MGIYVKFAQGKRPRTVRAFIKKYYSYDVNPYRAQGHHTYKDPECTVLQCNRSYRSFDDLLLLVNTYYRSISPGKLMHYLLTTKIPLQGENKFAQPHLSRCSGMERIRFIPYQDSAFEHIDTKMRLSQFTWRELLTPLGITNYAQFLEYIKNQK